MIYSIYLVAFGNGCAGCKSNFLARGAIERGEPGIFTAFERTAEEIADAR
jgi:hypothetical protein